MLGIAVRTTRERLRLRNMEGEHSHLPRTTHAKHGCEGMTGGSWAL